MKNISAFPNKQKALMIKSEHIDIAREYEIEHNGMTLRDYFAAKAMAAVLPAVMNELKKTRGSVKEAQRLQSLSAETCYVLADAMLKARDGQS